MNDEIDEAKFGKEEIEKEMEITKEDYQKAIYALNAVNLSGVVYSFSRVMKKICYRYKEYGTNWKNKHPICVLYSNAIANITAGPAINDNFQQAYDEVKKRIADTK